MKFIDVFETLCDKSQHMVSLHLTKGDGGRDVYFTYFHQVNLHDNNWRKTVRQRERGYKALFHAQSIMVPHFYRATHFNGRRSVMSKNLQQRVFAEKNDTEERLHENKQYERSIDNLISNFHTIVSKGPLYICTCCDQLWYKHSVSVADNFRSNNPNVSEFLLNKTSVNNKEWLCNTCKMHLKKNKVPPFAAVNGMQFKTKPPFLDLNELEWRLLAPRLAFVKLMQAPRGNQLKINGNIVTVPADMSVAQSTCYLG